MSTRPKPYLGQLLTRLAPELGASVLLEPTWGIAGQITFKNGSRRYFRYNTLDINTLGASEIAKDKDYASFFLEKGGFPTPTGKAFFSKKWSEAIHSEQNIDAAYAYAVSLGFPVVVKPNSGSQGTLVSVVHTKKEFYSALKEIFKADRVALVQKRIAGRDYRVVVLDGKIISAYERVPLRVVGDGTSSIRQLLVRKQAQFEQEGRDTCINLEDPVLLRSISRKGYSLESILMQNESVQLRDNANLSTGGDSIDVTHSIHPEFAKIAQDITSYMGLRLCGVDLMIETSIDEAPKSYSVLEINSAPGLDHYVKSGAAQEKIVEDLYREVLMHMEHA
ncbi:cyanophycin synthetase [Patescibacteria group bacterium]|nr:cyanophycin synthetase [Patescibacteria group bacterium]